MSERAQHVSTPLPAPTGVMSTGQESPSRRGTALAVRNLTKVYGKDVPALTGVNLEVAEGEFVTLLGPSGSGKTTLLMVIAGFESPTAGQVLAGGEDVSEVPPEHRNFGVVFQSYALFPHMSVHRNVAYPLSVRRVPARHREELVRRALDLVGLEGLGDRRPSQLSGGQQQRVALARALIYEPTILLLDEPLGALDRALRERMQVELRNLHRAVGVTFLYVTHDQDEALTMSDRVVVLREGRIEQVGTPQEVYSRPSTSFVASFVGTANLLPSRVRSLSDRTAEVELQSGQRIVSECDRAVIERSSVFVLVRPENVRVVRPEEPRGPDDVQLLGSIEGETFAGNLWRYEMSTPLGVIRAHRPARADARIGDPVAVRWSISDSWTLPDQGRGEVIEPFARTAVDQ